MIPHWERRKSNRSADSHVRALPTFLKNSKTMAKWITRTQRFALRVLGQHALKMRAVEAEARRNIDNSELACKD